ncbi:tumor necrosis factor receptor superfamily member 1A [Lampris incognitus]|uniref:tumor necrosis factor receptor superfamily member 1A n=1 Tax=Lampris incognitus TaxID=2546036 RepID=UPI0024B55A1E|nr:tumor necrosis factor receptor superfamily member 1A [Lampris incognitus]
MEGINLGGKWKKKAYVSVLLLCMSVHAFGLPSPASLVRVECPHGDYSTANGICCNMCPAGFKWGADCTAIGLRTKCLRCPQGEYRDQLNYAPNCRRCKRCKKFEEVVSECSGSHNTICRCKEGLYKMSIDSETYQCLKCSTCGPGKTQTQKCTPEHDTVCVCEKDYFEVKNKCLPCKNCTSDCSNCPTVHDVKNPAKSEDPTVKILVGGVLFLLVLMVFFTYKVSMLCINRRMNDSSIQPKTSPESTETLILTESPTVDDYDKCVPKSPVCESEPTNLPDCIPLEIKIPDLIYTVLDLVPVPQMKQLIRSLGVTDIEIERAESDHRACREAHYQMLRLWAERGSRSGGGGGGGGGRANGGPVRGGVLHQPLLQELLDTLKEINLGGVTEELEIKYGIQRGHV